MGYSSLFPVPCSLKPKNFGVAESRNECAIIWFWSSPRGSPNFAVRPKGDLLALGGAHRKG
ncbi:hypothetical protein, partial [Moorena sp. SIO4E2]|uniref:hypothetical protein n=1 Tax=Moorena sp. SIO4E2 TaxID=2607826 RepID=UPI002579C331